MGSHLSTCGFNPQLIPKLNPWISPVSPPNAGRKENEILWDVQGSGTPMGRVHSPAKIWLLKSSQWILLCKPGKSHFICLPHTGIPSVTPKGAATPHLGICLISHRFFSFKHTQENEISKVSLVFILFFLFWSRALKSKCFYSSGAAGVKQQMQKSWHYLCVPNISVWMEYFTSLHSKQTAPNPCSPKIPSIPWENFPAGSPSIYFIYLREK